MDEDWTVTLFAPEGVSVEELDRAHPDMERFSTGVVSFDAVIKGGVPVGSLVLLLGEDGAGASEFVYTSAAKLSMVRDKPDMMKFVFGDFYSKMRLPQQMTYVSLARTRSDIEREIMASFNPSLSEAFHKHVQFLDLSYHYFKGSPVPDSWIVDFMDKESEAGHVKFIYKPEETGTLIDHIFTIIEEHCKEGIVFIDSLTDLIISRDVNNREIMLLLKGLQRALNHWRGVVFFLLKRGVMPQMEEARLLDCFDAVMAFEWTESSRSSKRQRHMYFDKFRGVLPVLDRESIIRFNTEVSYQAGFVVVNAERIV